MYFSEFKNVFVQIATLAIYGAFSPTESGRRPMIAKHICLYCQMYFSEFKNVFVQIATLAIYGVFSPTESGRRPPNNFASVSYSQTNPLISPIPVCKSLNILSSHRNFCRGLTGGLNWLQYPPLILLLNFTLFALIKYFGPRIFSS